MIVPAAPEERPAAPSNVCPGAVVKALVRAHYWKRRLESGEFASIAEFAAAEKVDKSYLSKVIRLSLLAPILVQGILVETEPRHIQMERLLRPFPIDWERQQHWFAD
jgi:hypothetical protein